MNITDVINKLLNNDNEIFNLVKGKFGVWESWVKDKLSSMDKWRDSFISALRNDEVPVFNLVPNAKLDMTDKDGNFVMFGFYWWRSRIASIKTERIKIADSSWWTSPQYALRITIKGSTADSGIYACLWAGAYSESNAPANHKRVRTTRAFKYRVIANNGANNRARIGWETGSKNLDMSISNDWKEASVTTEGNQTNPLISFYLEAGKEIIIEITNIRINLGNSDRETLPLNRLANLAVRGEWQ